MVITLSTVVFYFFSKLPELSSFLILFAGNCGILGGVNSTLSIENCGIDGSGWFWSSSGKLMF